MFYFSRMCFSDCSETRVCWDKKIKGGGKTTWNWFEARYWKQTWWCWYWWFFLFFLQLWPALFWELSSVLVDPHTGAKTPRPPPFAAQSPTANKMSGTSLMWSVVFHPWPMNTCLFFLQSWMINYLFILEICAMWLVQRGVGCGGQTAQGELNRGECIVRWWKEDMKWIYPISKILSCSGRPC